MTQLRLSSLVLGSFLLATLGCGGGGSSGGSSAPGSAPPSPPALPQASLPDEADSDQADPDPSPSSGGSSVAPVGSAAPSPVASSSASGASATAPLSTLTFAQVRVPASFDFATTRRVSFSVTANEAEGGPASYRRIELSSLEGAVLYRGRTDAAGELETTLLVSTALERIRVAIDAVGIASWQDVSLAEQLTLHFGPR